MAGMLQTATVNREACHAPLALGDPLLLATDLADYLVRKGVPFRKAHHLVGQAVGIAEQSGKPLSSLSLAQWRAISPKFEEDTLQLFDLKTALDRRDQVGAPSARQVASQLARWRKILF